MEIDWSKAPKGATHGRKTYDGYDWYKIVDGDFCYLTRHGYWQPAITSMAECTIRPVVTEWTGDGLPPVGLLCEAYYHSDTRPGWKPFTLLFLGNETIVFRRLGEVARERREFELSGPKEFRPLCTTEQIAEEECDTAVRVILSEFKHTGSLTSHYEVCEVLHKAGYRKFEIVEDDACPD